MPLRRAQVAMQSPPKTTSSGSKRKIPRYRKATFNQTVRVQSAHKTRKELGNSGLISFEDRNRTPSAYNKHDLEALISTVLNHAEANSQFLEDLKSSGGAKFIRDYLYKSEIEIPSPRLKN
jgi:hypothetical protein